MTDQSRQQRPSRAKIAGLPRWAQVAFAVRCALRVQPLFRQLWPGATQAHLDAIDDALFLATSPASGGDGGGRDASEVNAAANAAANAGAAVSASAAASARAAVDAAVSAASGGAAATNAHTSNAASNADRAAADVGLGDCSIAHVRAMWQDYRLLADRATSERWTDDTSVPPEVFGPLWPDGEPDGWLSMTPDKQAALLPPNDELAKLPRWARVAFAGRCVLRVQPLFRYSWPDAPPKHVQAIDQAIRIVQTSAVDPAAFRGRATASAAVRAAVNAGLNAAGHAGAASSAAVNVASAAHHALDARYVRDAAFEAARSAFDAIFAAHPAASNDTVRAIRTDYEVLKQASVTEAWTDETPVTPEFFGPLWPEGEPEGWLSARAPDEEGPRTLELAIDVPADADDDEISERVGAFIRAMSARHKELGGTGLILDGLEITSDARITHGGTS